MALLKRRGYFRPDHRGGLERALESKETLNAVAPETPRPLEMLEQIAVHGVDRLTTTDWALHELLVTAAYERDKAMAAEGFSLPMAQALVFLGQHARRATVRESLARLRDTTVTYGVRGGRQYEGVPLIVGWTSRDEVSDDIEYVLPKPVRTMMSSMPDYAYLELDAIGRMKARNGSGIKLYRGLARAMSRKKWLPRADNLHVVEVSAKTMARWLGYAEPNGKPLHIGHLRERAVEPAIRDLVHVKRFEVVGEGEGIVERVQVRRAKRKGAPIEAWIFTLRLNRPPEYHLLPAGISDEALVHVGGADEPRFRVHRKLWLRAAELARKHRVASSAIPISRAWLVAVQEALNGAPATEGSEARLRGQRLLDAVDRRGARAAAWDWFIEELEGPDLLAQPDVAGRSWYYIERDARAARIRRWKASKQKDSPRPVPANPSPKAVAQPSPKAARVAPQPPREEAPQAAPAPTAESVSPTAPLSWVEFILDEVATEADAEAMQESIFEMTLSGDPSAAVDGTIRYRAGLGTDTLCLGELPISDADLSFIAKRFANIIDDVSVGREEV